MRCGSVCKNRAIPQDHTAVDRSVCDCVRALSGISQIQGTGLMMSPVWLNQSVVGKKEKQKEEERNKSFLHFMLLITASP